MNYNNSIYKINQNEIYHVFYCNSDMYNNIVFSLLGIRTSLESCIFLINQYSYILPIHELAHNTMNFNNNFTYIGNRFDCKMNLSFPFCGAGFVIEKVNQSYSILFDKSLEKIKY